jgi:hypothetical protein
VVFSSYKLDDRGNVFLTLLLVPLGTWQIKGMFSSQPPHAHTHERRRCMLCAKTGRRNDGSKCTQKICGNVFLTLLPVPLGTGQIKGMLSSQPPHAHTHEPRRCMLCAKTGRRNDGSKCTQKIRYSLMLVSIQSVSKKLNGLSHLWLGKMWRATRHTQNVDKLVSNYFSLCKTITVACLYSQIMFHCFTLLDLLSPCQLLSGQMVRS